MKIRDRIQGLERVKASELRPHPKNWRTHPKSQQDAMRGVLAQVGYADAVLVYESKKGDGYTIIDGHLRAETTPDTDVPCLVLDVDDAEAEVILATHDPLAGMALMDPGVLRGLLDGLPGVSEEVDLLIRMLSDQADAALDIPDGQKREGEGKPNADLVVVNIECPRDRFAADLKSTLELWSTSGIKVEIL